MEVKDILTLLKNNDLKTIKLKEQLWQKLNSYQQSSNIASAVNIFTKLTF